ncbi:MAG: MFS transporter [Rhizomicrobium sp.]
MAYFRNSTVNLLNLHYGIFAVMMTGGGAFYCVYLYKAGVSLPMVLVAMAAILAVRFAVRPAVVPLAIRLGLRRMVMLGAVVIGLQFPVVALVHGTGWILFVLIVISAVGDAIYWSCYHAYFAALGDSEHRGHQVGAREALVAIVGIVSPLATGWLLVKFGAMTAFGATAVVMFASALPLLWTSDVAVAPHVDGAWRAALPGIKLFMADGWTQAGIVFVWQLALFVTLGESFLRFGGALAIAALVGAVAGLFLGRHIDAGHGRSAVVIAIGAMTIVVLSRAASAGHETFAIVANALVAISTALYTPTLMTAVYNQAKRSPCTLRFHVATEGGWDAGAAGGSLAAAAMLWLGLPMWSALLLPLFGLLAAFAQLRGYYAENPVAELAVADAIGGAPERQ